MDIALSSQSFSAAAREVQRVSMLVILLMRDAVWQVPSWTFDVVPNFMEKKCVACAWGWGSFLDPWNSLNQTFQYISSSPIPGFQIFLERVRTKNVSLKRGNPSLFGPDVSGEKNIAFSNPQGIPWGSHIYHPEGLRNPWEPHGLGLHPFAGVVVPAPCRKGQEVGIARWVYPLVMSK